VTRAVAIVAARDEADRVATTVRALAAIRGVDRVVVADDGSTDDTAGRAWDAGAVVVRRARPGGKGAALEAGIRAALEDDRAVDVYLLADGDLGASAAALEGLVDRVASGGADLAIAIVPAGEGGGFGVVKRAAARAIRRLGGPDVRAPLSGQRALSPSALAAVRPLAHGFGVETAMTIDAARAGLRIEEVPADVSHRPTYRDVRGFVHRGRQGFDIARAVLVRSVRRR